MKRKIKEKIFRKFFKEFEKVEGPRIIYDDIDEEDNLIINEVERFTITGKPRIVSLIKAVRHIEKHRIQGDIVECGVYKGGSIMAVLRTLCNLNSFSRNIYLYDTFEGMPPPTNLDTSFEGKSAAKAYRKKDSFWSHVSCYSSLEEVQNNLNKIGYPFNKIYFVKGKVEDTIPKVKIPERISILRLDTDWYESTRHELNHLFPRLEKGGILIIDDYGHWKGCRKAVDEYFEENKIEMYLNRIDYSCRIGVKL